MPAVMKLINNLNSINTCFSNGYELRGSMGARQSHNNNNNSNGLVMNGSNHLTRSTRNRLKEPLTVECNGFSNSVSVRSDGVLVEKGDAPGRLCRSKSKSCGTLLGPLLSPDIQDPVRPRRHLWKLPSCLLGTTAEDTRNPREIFLRSKSDSEAKPAKLPEKVPGDYTHKTESKSNHVTSGCKYFESISKLHTEYEEEYHEDRKHNKADRKLLEDNKEYYKLEVLSTKLRSTRQYVKEYEMRRTQEANGCMGDSTMHMDHNGDLSNQSSNEDSIESRYRTRQSRCEENQLGRKGLKYRHSLEEQQKMEADDVTPVKKSRQNKFTLVERLNMEADEFMFGDPRRELEEQESSPDSVTPKRKRKSQVELFLIDNLDYYKFELPASRLRNGGDFKETIEESEDSCKGTIRIDFDAVKYSFEMGIQSELWYQVFLRSRSKVKQTLWENKVPHQSKILLPFERRPRPRASSKSKPVLPPPPPPPEDLPPPSCAHPLARRRKRRLSSILEDDSRPRKSPRCHASTQAILSSSSRRPSEEDYPTHPAHEPEHFPECCEFARGHPYSCDVSRLVDKLGKQCRLNTSQLDLCEILRQYSRSYYTAELSSASQPVDNSSDCGASLDGAQGGKRTRGKKRRINMTGWPCRPRRKVAGKVLNYNESLLNTIPSVPVPSVSPACDVKTLPSPSQKKKPGRKKKKKSNRYKY